MGLFYKIFAIALVSFYAATGFLGWELGASERNPLPPNVRQSPGGYRSFNFWYGGYSGGK